MEPTPKSPQEMAAQILDAYPTYDEVHMPESQVTELAAQARQMKQELEASNPYMLSDDELAARLADIKSRALQTGVWDAHKGSGAEERIEYTKNKLRGYGFAEEELASESVKILSRAGFLGAIKMDRKVRERNFSEPTKGYIGEHRLSALEEKKFVAELLDRTIDLTAPTGVEQLRLASQFPGGNFLYHGAGTEQLIAIMHSGNLANYKALRSQEEASAKAEGRDENIVYNNSGYEGISWSMNGIDALPGDRYHMAGFMVAPEKALGKDEQLAVPSRPAPNEVIQLSADINANRFYDAKAQLELYKSTGIFGEKNSVLGNILSVISWADAASRDVIDEPLLYTAKTAGVLARSDYQATLRKFYEVEPDGVTRLNSDLLQQVRNEIPVAAVWLQAAVDGGKLKETIFSGKEVKEIVDTISEHNYRELLDAAAKDWSFSEQIIDDAEKVSANITVPVEDMYFVAPRKDADVWFKVIARSGHRPAGILLYDDKKIRLENFASMHKGDHQELTDELRSVVVPGEDYIDYSSVFGDTFTDDMRVGFSHQVVAEKYLANRGVVKLVDGKLKVER